MLKLSVVELNIESVIVERNRVVYELASGYHLVADILSDDALLYFDTQCPEVHCFKINDIVCEVTECSTGNINGDEMSLLEWVEMSIEVMSAYEYEESDWDCDQAVEEAIEASNHEWASIQTAIDEAG